MNSAFFNYNDFDMIGFVEGTIEYLTPAKTFINVNGVGYEVHISLFTYEAIKEQETTRLFTHIQVREDAWVMYGFSDIREKEVFLQLVSVSGVGAATARVIISSLSYAELSRIVANGDNKSLERVKGIGAKTAQRIILELRGKLVPADEPADGKFNKASHNTIVEDALNALAGLGISKANAEQAIVKIEQQQSLEGLKVEELIKLALKNL